MNPKDWYRCCGDSIRAEFGADSELFIDLLAATSPRKQITTNWRLAMRIYHVWKTGIWRGDWKDDGFGNLLKGTLPAHRPNVLRALKREPLSGNKVRAFAANLKGNLDEVTLDVWMCRYFNHEGSLTDKKYAELSARIITEARQQGLKPAELQAIIWWKMIRKSGKQPQSYISVKDRGQLFFDWYLDYEN